MPITSETVAENWRVWDATECLSYVSHRRTGDKTYKVDVARRRALKYTERAASGGVYVALDRNFLIPKSLLTVTPKSADWFFDVSKTQWTVLEVDQIDHDTVWKLTSRDLVLVADLRDSVTILSPVNNSDGTGARNPTFVPIYQHVAARIQEGESEVRDERGKRLTVRNFNVYLGQRVTVTQECQLQDERNGDLYEILGDSNPDRIDELQYLNCQRRGW